MMRILAVVSASLRKAPAVASVVALYSVASTLSKPYAVRVAVMLRLMYSASRVRSFGTT